MIIQCMGGWCKSRDKCLHYVIASRSARPPVERLCGQTEDPEHVKAKMQPRPDLVPSWASLGDRRGSALWG
jgi:hypothetical protein